MKKMVELNVGEIKEVAIEKAELGYATVEGVEYFVMGSDDFEEEVEYNSLDTFYVSKDKSKVFILDESSEFPNAIVKRIR